jgi:hypothetical protein
MPEHLRARHGLSRRMLLQSSVSLGAAATFGTGVWAAGPNVTKEMGLAAASVLGLLDSDRRKACQLPWGDRIDDWHYIPRDRPGLSMGSVTAAQSKALWDLLATLLSTRGLDQVRGQLRVEGILGELTGEAAFRDPGNYALVVFGDPSGPDPWAWRLEGHHLSLTIVVAPDYGVSVTPAFFGANPAKVAHHHHHAGFRLLGAEEDTAFSLIRSLDGKAREAAIIADRSLGQIVSGPGRETVLKSFEGASLSTLNEAQRAGVMHILELYAGTMRDEIAAAAMARVNEIGTDKLHFAWAGSLEPGKPHYFRIHGPSALVEYDNTQNGANHVHSVWIDPDGVFGRDLLKAHYQGQH